MMKEPIEKKPFYRDRNFLTGFVFSMVIVLVFFLFVARPARLKAQQQSTALPNQPGLAAGTEQPGGWQAGITFIAPGSLPSDLLRVGNEVWIFTDEGKKLAKLDLSGVRQSEIMLETLCSKAAWDGEAVWCTDMGNVVAQLDAATGKVLLKFDIETDSTQSIAWDGESLWLMTQTGSLASFDRSGKELETKKVGKNGFARDLAWVGDELWVVHIPPLLVRYDAQLKEIEKKDSFCGLTQGILDYSIAWDGESLWFLDFISGQVTQCSPVE
jgi:hypothetical protein